VPRRSEVCNINGALSTPSYLLALLRELSHVPQALTEVIEPGTKNELNTYFVPDQKEWSKNQSLYFKPRSSCISFSKVQVHPQLARIVVLGGGVPLVGPQEELSGPSG